MPKSSYDYLNLKISIKQIAQHFTKHTKHDDVIKWKHFPRYMALCAGNSHVTGELPAQRQVTRSFDVFFDLRLNKGLSKQSWGWWFETPSHQLWRHCNECINCIQFSTLCLKLTMFLTREVEWAECLLIIETGCRVQVFSLILDSSVGLSAGIQSAGE